MKRNPSIFERFGGIRPMAKALGEAPSTVQDWKRTGRIPAGKQPLVLERAEAAGIVATADDIVFPNGRPSSKGAGCD